jgi:hypothetical protein
MELKSKCKHSYEDKIIKAWNQSNCIEKQKKKKGKGKDYKFYLLPPPPKEK